MRITAAVLSLSAALAVALSVVVASVPGHADNGCPGNLVPRNARPGDQVCVTPQLAAQVAQENANAANLRQPGGGAYGPLTCKSGYVWREAFDGDGVCVTPQRRQETLNQNATAPKAAAAPPAGDPNAPPPPPPKNAPQPTPTPTPQPTPSATPQPTPSAAPQPTPSASPQPTPSAAPQPTPPPANVCDPTVDICLH